MKKILKCPVCGCRMVWLTFDDLGPHAFESYVKCGGCKNAGPRKNDPFEAVDAWNRESKKAVVDKIFRFYFGE